MTEYMPEMDLHEELKVSSEHYVLRVPGGWVYTHYSNGEMASVFVPLCGEFKEPKK